MRTRIVLLSALVSLLAIGACSSGTRTGAFSVDPVRSSIASPGPGASGARSPGTTTASGSPGTAASAGPGASGSPATSSGNLAIEIVLPACIERTRPAHAVIRTTPGTMLVASATYSDGQSYYNYWVGVADARGEYAVAWAPPPEAPLGRGKFLVGAQSDGGGSTAVKEFRLSAAGRC